MFPEPYKLPYSRSHSQNSSTPCPPLSNANCPLESFVCLSKMRFSTCLSILSLAAGIASAGRSLQHVGKKDLRAPRVYKRTPQPDKNKRAESSLNPRYLNTRSHCKIQSLLSLSPIYELIQFQHLRWTAIPFLKSTLISANPMLDFFQSRHITTKPVNCSFGSSQRRIQLLPMRSLFG